MASRVGHLDDKVVVTTEAETRSHVIAQVDDLLDFGREDIGIGAWIDTDGYPLRTQG